MRVWVLMGNDYPAGVFASEQLGNAEIERRKMDEQEMRDRGMKHRDWIGIYWRLYPFELVYPVDGRSRTSRRTTDWGSGQQAVLDELKSGPKRYGELQPVFEQSGHNGGGLGNTLNNLIRKKKIRKTGYGVYELVVNASADPE